MNDKNLGKALLDIDAAGFLGSDDLRQQARLILERDGRRLRLLTGATILLWLAAAALLLGALVAFALLMPSQALILRHAEEGKLRGEALAAEQLAHLFATQKVTVLMGFAVSVFGLAALTTILLVLAGRRATMRQFNAQLVEISEQLRLLRSAPPPRPAEGGTT
jgi:hypothetical protein